MYTTFSQFKKEYLLETETTLSVLQAIPNSKLNIKPHNNIRSMQRLVWHITITHGEMLGKAGLTTIDCPDEHSDPLSNIEDIIKTYKTTTQSVLQEVEKHWTDDKLNDLVDIYGEQWTKGTILNVLIKHEIHHRGQLSVIMRLLDIKVPSIYGPSKEDWANYNLPAAE